MEGCPLFYRRIISVQSQVINPRAYFLTKPISITGATVYSSSGIYVYLDLILHCDAIKGYWPCGRHTLWGTPVIARAMT